LIRAKNVRMDQVRGGRRPSRSGEERRCRAGTRDGRSPHSTRVGPLRRPPPHAPGLAPPPRRPPSATRRPPRTGTVAERETGGGSSSFLSTVLRGTWVITITMEQGGDLSWLPPRKSCVTPCVCGEKCRRTTAFGVGWRSRATCPASSSGGGADQGPRLEVRQSEPWGGPLPQGGVGAGRGWYENDEGDDNEDDGPVGAGAQAWPAQGRRLVLHTDRYRREPSSTEAREGAGGGGTSVPRLGQRRTWRGSRGSCGRAGDATVGDGDGSWGRCELRARVTLRIFCPHLRPSDQLSGTLHSLQSSASSSCPPASAGVGSAPTREGFLSTSVAA